ncbi:MAG: hypothetical protein QM520_00565 [Gammaproteobacteria bacterium]|nr:hypothetical protein [Gammaproteobacteria bacterium]
MFLLFKLIERNIFPEYYLITVERFKNTIKNSIDEWIYIFKNNQVAPGSVSKNIDKAVEKLNLMNLTKEERDGYENYLINFVRDKDVINTAKAEGEALGIQKGKIEGKIEIARNMIEDGELNEKIVKYTGVTVKDIEKLRNGG